jgi:quercetin dioxygenase-like cupin family protein
MGKIVLVNAQELDWQVPGDEWPGKVAGDEPAVKFKPLESETSFAKVQIAHYEPGHVEKPHSHPGDEVLFMLDGELTIGDDMHVGSETAIFIERDTIYGPLVAGAGGATFFRVEMAH